MEIHDLEQRISDLEAELSRLREERIPQVDRSSRRRDRRLTIAYLVAGVLAVGLAGVGSASALDGSNTVFSDDIVDGTVAGVDVKDASIGGVDIKNSSVAGIDVADGSLTGADVADGGLRGADIADGSVTGLDLDLFDDNQCTLETVLGTASVNADPAVPDLYTDQWLAWQHSCSGATVQVKRLSVGYYYVKFSNSARLAVVSATGGIAIPVVRNTAAGEFQISLYTPDLLNTDTDFTILAY